MDSNRQAVAATGLLVAAMRAEESARADPLFVDPFAERLAGEAGRQLLAEATSDTGQSSGQIVIRTRFWDEALLRAESEGVTQVVILAAGMDARAYRLPWQSDTTIYEVDQPQVIATKDQLLADEQPRCRRVAVGADLAGDWPTALQSQGFSPSSRTVWLIEGLLQYIQPSDVDTLFTRIDALSAAGSLLFYDIVGTRLMEAPFLQPTLEFMRQLGAPWRFSTDAPAALVEGRGWTAIVTDVSEPGNRWSRWEFPVVPLDVPNVPRGYFVEAWKA
jgi:methyltransferase (TIGR00027 family)